MKIGKKIRDKRKELRLTQEELAKMVGYTSKSTITKIENDKIDVSMEKIQLIAKALDVSPNFLTNWTSNNKYSVDILTEEQKIKLEHYIESSNVMYFNGSIDDTSDNKNIIREALTKAYIEILRNKGEIK
ncbi:helix-turn-helix domain-containing protein [Oceanivirga salmonicida]|uniref:helix-turn-helix domain-containing protein n=1 Tax=Oceanivirga salmonicida TaxID=1769291 RepID=UPI000834AF93|nr:helix-turn-helix transcriptional regulator [Oceanivirga salmonicida]